jgi:hypothetical protein
VPDLEFVRTRHEEIAAFAATAHAKLTGEVGVCLATSGPGAVQMLNGLYDAKLDHAPVVAIVGQQARMSLGASYQQEVDLQTLYKDVAHEYVEVCMDPRQAAHLVDRAVRIVLSQRTVTAIIVPNDVQEMPYEEPPRAHGAVHSSPGWNALLIVPRDDDLRRAADVLNAGERVAMLVGRGARHATDEVLAVAELLGAGIAKALNGRAVVPDDVPYVTGAIGLLGTKPSDDMMQGCDTLLMVGTSFPYSEWLPEVGQARAVQIDIDPRARRAARARTRGSRRAARAGQLPGPRPAQPVDALSAAPPTGRTSPSPSARSRSSCAARARRTPSPSTATRTSSATRAWARTQPTASATPTTGSGGCRTSSSPTAARCRRRARPTRRSRSWPSPRASPTCSRPNGSRVRVAGGLRACPPADVTRLRAATAARGLGARRTG